MVELRLKMRVKISILMPVYNSQKYLRLAIDSILDQTLEDFQFIIIDDGSTDRSWKIIKSYSQKDKRIVAIRSTINLKTSSALNKGLAKVQGKYVIRMDADDWSYPDRLENQYKYMENHPEVGISGGAVEVCNERLETINKRNYPLTDEAARKIIFRYSPFAHPATIWRTSVLKAVNGYNENIPYSQDAELYFKVGKFSEFGNINETVIKLRMHKKSSSYSKARMQEIYAIYARIKASMEYDYKASFSDKFWIFLRIIIMFIIPLSIKFRLFNFMRGAK